MTYDPSGCLLSQRPDSRFEQNALSSNVPEVVVKQRSPTWRVINGPATGEIDAASPWYSDSPTDML